MFAQNGSSSMEEKIGGSGWSVAALADGGRAEKFLMESFTRLDHDHMQFGNEGWYGVAHNLDKCIYINFCKTGRL